MVVNNDNVTGNTTKISNDDDDTNLNIDHCKVTDAYHLDCCYGSGAKEKKTKTNTTVSFTKYKSRVMNIVVWELQPRPSNKSDDDDDDDPSKILIDDDDDELKKDYFLTI